MGGGGIISRKGKRRLIDRSSVKQSRANVKRRPHFNLIELPMDIIFEIFGYLEPLDLLQVLETSRAFFNLLTGASSRVVWSRARANIPGLPDCPDDLSEVEYARLAFEIHCQACHQGKSYDVQTTKIWAARARFCGFCIDAHFIQEKLGRKHKKSYPGELRALLPSIVGWHQHTCISLSLDDLWEKEYKRLKTDQERRQWTNSKIAERRKINAHAALCETWFKFWVKESVQRRKRQAEGRKEKIMDCLRELGWEEEIRINESCNGLLFDRRVRRACEKDFSEKALRDVVEYLNDYLNQARELRLSFAR